MDKKEVTQKLTNDVVEKQFQPDGVRIADPVSCRRIVTSHLTQSKRKFEIIEPLEQFKITDDEQKTIEFISRYILMLERHKDDKEADKGPYIFKDLTQVARFNLIWNLSPLERAPILLAFSWLYSSADAILSEEFFR